MVSAPLMREIDNFFAELMLEKAVQKSGLLRQVCCDVSAASSSGNICLHLGSPDSQESPEAVAVKLLASGVVGRPGEFKPLVLDAANRLYLYRFWQYEARLAQVLRRMVADRPVIDHALLADGLTRLFGETPPETVDWQKVAAAAAVRSRFCVISGGPGTGKTTTVVKIMALLLEQAGDNGLRLALAAPTGKAAARLKQSIAGAREKLAGITSVAAQLPEDVSTLHRLMGVRSTSSRFVHNTENLLACDVLVIDEASMVPLPLLAKVVDALGTTARLILLGDRDQLASVEAGAVLGDICDTGREESDMLDAVVVLQRNYRFDQSSALGALSRAVNSGEAGLALKIFQDVAHSGVQLDPTPVQTLLENELEELVLTGYGAYLKLDEPWAALKAFDDFRVLCALRAGVFGVEGMNRAIERCLERKQLIRPDRTWYRGRPVMVTVNDYTLRLFNGDIGITLPDPESDGSLRVFFPTPEGGVRKIIPARLPQHETVFAMTIHKSQGSEFENVLLVFPPFDSQTLTREIVYTGMTRAKSSVLLWCNEDIFRTMIGRRVERISGLRDALWGDNSYQA